MKLRLAGGALMLLCVLLFAPGAQTDLQRLWLPLLMGVGAMLILQNVLAIAATGALIGFLRMDFNGDWISALAYPGIAMGCAAVCGYLLGRRFQQRMRATRADRAAQRQQRSGQNPDQDPDQDPDS
ncbi:MAG: hypothetical protein AB8B93_17755 [Pseudomonadales bacterium]